MKPISLLLAAIFICLAFSGKLGAQGFNVRDSLALVEFFDSTDGPNWKDNYNWKTAEPVTRWNGIGTNGTRVTSFQMNGNNINGRLPASFGNFDSLRYITMIDNRIGGTIPETFGNLKALTSFNLGANDFTGQIPASLGNLTNLKILYFYATRLSGSLPSSLNNLKNLEDLDISYSQFSGNLYEAIGDLDSLHISMVDNRFTFEGIEQLAQRYSNQNYFGLYYSPQANIPVTQIDDRLSVSVGGTPANNTYKWFKEGTGLIATKTADSTFEPTMPGSYYVEITNAIAKELILTSNVTRAKSVKVEACPSMNVLRITADISGASYQWQFSTDGINFTNIDSSSNYSGVYTATINMFSIPSAWYGYMYRCMVNGESSTVFKLAFANKWINNNTSSDWANPANWSCGRLPDANTDVVIDSGTVIVNTNTVILSLKLSPGASLTVNPGYALTITQQ